MTGVVVFTAFIVSSGQIFTTIFDKTYEEKGISITNSLDAGFGINDLNDSEKLQNTITKFIYLNSDIYSLVINSINENDQLVVIASNENNLIGQKSSGESQESYLNNSVLSEKITLNNGDKGVRIVSPILLSGQKMGTYEVFLSTQRAWNELIQKLTIFLILISIFVLFSSMIFYFAAKRTVVLPIQKLIVGSQEIGKGNLNYKIELNSEDEMEELAQAINKSSEILSDMYRNMGEKIKERTDELTATLEKMEVQNIALENNKKAMLNILEDDKDLEKALKIEKENVERKVIERTMELSNIKAKLDSSIENLPLGFLMVDADEKYIVVNSLTKKILGGKDEKENLLKLKKVLKEKIDLNKFISKDGTDKRRLNFPNVEIGGRYYQFLLSPILSHDVKEVFIGVVILIQDTTEAKILERSKDEFFSIASHELRTPLTAIRGNTSMILEYYAEAIKEPELKAMVDDIHESSIRLINIVNDFLNVSRLEQSRMVFDIKKFDIDEIIRETLKEYNVTGSRKKLSLDYVKLATPLPLVLGDADKVRQVLINLVGNSLKFTSKGGVKISTEILDKFVKVLVSDTGRGIPLKQQSLLFHKFQQTGESLFTRDTAGGSGLGLYISRMMLEGMGGEVILEKSEVNVGTTFSFTIPLAPKK